jgi:hypothetical protein
LFSVELGFHCGTRPSGYPNQGCRSGGGEAPESVRRLAKNLFKIDE